MKQEPVQIAVGNENGMVILKFDRDISHVEMEANNAIAIAGAITDNAFVCRDGVKPVGDTLKAELIERHRVTLTQRYNLVLGTLRYDYQKTNGAVALELVEIALKEIF